MKPCMQHKQVSSHPHPHQSAHPLSRREFLKGVGSLAAGLALASCAPEAKSTSDNAAQINNGARPTVAIAKAETYDRTLIRQQVEKLFDSIGGLGDVLAHGNRVAIKTITTMRVKTKVTMNCIRVPSIKRMIRIDCSDGSIESDK